MNDENKEGRDESADERADRRWGDLLQELRVMQTGVQLLAGFLLTLPFQDRFEELDEFQRDHYLVLVVLAGVTTALVLSPVAAHRALSGRQVKDRLVETAGLIAIAALGGVSLLVVGITTFLFDVVVGRIWAVAVGGSMALVLVTLLVLLPRRLITKDLV